MRSHLRPGLLAIAILTLGAPADARRVNDEPLGEKWAPSANGGPTTRSARLTALHPN